MDVRKASMGYSGQIKGSIRIAPTGIAPTFLKLDLWSLGADFIYIISTKGNQLDKERKIVRKKLSCMHTKRFNIFSKIRMQSIVGAIPRLPKSKLALN